MSLYHMINKETNMSVFFVLPLLGKHPEQYPRFRDSYIEDKKPLTQFDVLIKENSQGKSTDKQDFSKYQDTIKIYTRVGGGNRESFKEEIEKLQKSKGYVADFDDNFDCTYATFIFKIPEEFIEDVRLIKENYGNIRLTSKKYKDFIINFWKTKSSQKEFYKKIEGLLAEAN